MPIDSQGSLARYPRPFVLTLILALLASPRVDADEPTPLPTIGPEAAEWLESTDAAAFGEWLQQAVRNQPDPPEWLAMFANILQGSRLGPTDGWFPLAQAQTRYDWDATRSRLDANGDGQVTRDEFPGSDEDFARLDRSRDGRINPPDFDWSAHALAASPGMMLYYMADTNGDGKVAREELLGLFDQVDSGRQGFLSLDDLRNLLPMPGMPSGATADAPPGDTPEPARRSGPSKATLVRGLFAQEIGALAAGPKVGESAPDFLLETVEGDRAVALSEQIGEKPVVLVFGNFTCGPFRSQAGNVEKLYERYKDRANFLMIYVREAHPTDGWHMPDPAFDPGIPQPATYDERRGIAETCQRTLGFDMPFLVDTIDDAVGGTYSGMPSRLYLIDADGTVAYKSGRGPFGFKPAELEQSLLLHLADREPGEDPAP